MICSLVHGVRNNKSRSEWALTCILMLMETCVWLCFFTMVKCLWFEGCIV